MRKGNECKCGNPACTCPSGRTPRFLEPSIILLLKKVPSYGYELMDNLKKGSFLGTKPDPGAVYRILRRLEGSGHIISEWQTNKAGPAKRIYSVTQKGKKLLNEWARSIQKKREDLERFMKEYNRKTEKEK